MWAESRKGSAGAGREDESALRQYEVLGLSDIYLDYAGMFPQNHAIHAHLARIQAGEKVSLAAEDASIKICDKEGFCVGRLSQSASSRWKDKLDRISDVRVVVVGDYVEAYIRENFHNFRANLAVGGASRALSMDAAAEGLCREVMARGRFPYAHIDLQLAEGGGCYLSEIALDGGISAARIGRQELNRRKREALEKALGEVSKMPKVR